MSMAKTSLAVTTLHVHQCFIAITLKLLHIDLRGHLTLPQLYHSLGIAYLSLLICNKYCFRKHQ